MATNTEIRTLLKSWLYDAMKLKKENGTIDDLIEKYRATMEQEDFAFVEKVVNENKQKSL
jgi:hypothetical protein